MELDAVRVEAKRAQVAAELEVQELSNLANATQTERELEHLKIRQGIDNELSAQRVQSQLIAQLSEIAKNMPAQELRTTIISAERQEGVLLPLLNFVAGALSLAQDTFKQPDEPQDTEE
jgi:hypothetical protein